jgi:hypothetical protein
MKNIIIKNNIIIKIIIIKKILKIIKNNKKIQNCYSIVSTRVGIGLDYQADGWGFYVRKGLAKRS